jgi:hypothetical protein
MEFTAPGLVYCTAKFSRTMTQTYEKVLLLVCQSKLYLGTLDKSTPTLNLENSPIFLGFQSFRTRYY